MNVLLVHAHAEPASFSSALKDLAVATLTRLGHTVEVSDLYAMGFDPVSDRRNFSTVADPAFLKQQNEESYATEHDGFAPELAAEIEKLLRADLLIFNFPLWWFGLPATLKGWVDRVFAHGAIYEAGKLYENGIGRGKRALVTVTTGSAGATYDGYGWNPAMTDVLTPIHHGIFWFNGFAPMPPFVAYSVARASDAERARLLGEYETYLSTLDERAPIVLPPLTQFDEATRSDRYGRWMVEFPHSHAIDEARIADLQRAGTILSFWRSTDGEPDPAMWAVVRVESRSDAKAIAEKLAGGPGSDVTIRELRAATA